MSAPHDKSTPAFDEEAFLAERRRRRRRGGGHAIPGQDIGALNLTPLMDIMTILLVFLIQSLAVEPSNINVTLDLRPPESTATRSMESATKITITAREVLIDDKVVMDIDKMAPDARGVVQPISDALAEQVTKIKAMEKSFGGPPFDEKLLIVANQKTPYAVISTVLTSAGVAQYSEFKLVVMKKSDGK